MIILEDDLGQSVQIKNVRHFFRHINEFHSIGSSIHKERGHSFTVDDDFRYILEQQINKQNDPNSNHPH
jgi:hypothetical protein